MAHTHGKFREGSPEGDATERLAARNGSTPARIVKEILSRYTLDEAHAVLDEILDQFPALDLAAHEFDWSFWARPKQIPADSDWQSWGQLCGRGTGKTLAISKFVNQEVEAGRAMLIGLAAQDEDNSIKLQVTGPSGLIATAPPWFKPEWRVSELELIWPNGARAFVRTPEVPGKIRGLEYHLSWLSEIQSWPKATMAEAFMNFLLSTRLGYSRIVWDATPKRRHPIIKELLANGERNPRSHIVMRGSTYENELNLGPEYIPKLEAAIGGTQRGREELLGEMLDDAEGALVRQDWIEENRRELPLRFSRRVVSIDPATTKNPGSDDTGIVELGLGTDGQVYVLQDQTQKHGAGDWADLVIDMYLEGKCECVIAETNKGGSLVAQNLRSVAALRKIKVEVLPKDARPKPHMPGVILVREVHARGAKADRAEPVATAYEKGRISHVKGADLRKLEDTLTGWEPGPRAESPGDLDALVHGVVELLGLSNNKVDHSAGFKGLDQVGKSLGSPMQALTKGLNTLLGGGADRI